MVCWVSLKCFCCEYNPLAYHPYTTSYTFASWNINTHEFIFSESVFYNKDASCHYTSFGAIILGNSGNRGPMYNDAFGRLEQMIYCDSTLTDTNSRQLFHYNANNQPDTVTFQAYNKTATNASDLWIETAHIYYTYQNNRKASYIYQVLDTVFKNSIQEYYYYDTTGKLTQKNLIQSLCYSTCTNFRDSSVSYFYYDSVGNEGIEESNKRRWNSPYWEPNYIKHFAYDNNNYRHEEIDSNWDAATQQMQLDNKKVITNNDEGLPVEKLTLSLDSNGVWQTNVRETYEYCIPVISSVHQVGINNLQFSISPNPASNTVNISIDESMVGSTLTVTDIMGRKLAAVQLQTTNNKLETTNLATGVYLVSISNGEHRATRKLVIEK